MLHQTPLIATIIGGLVLAFIFGALANRLRMPPLIGYLVAGIVAGPFTPGFVADTHLAQELAEIGVILLMFGVGLHFSLKDLLAVKYIAIPGAVLQITFATLLGMGLAWGMGWTLGQGLIFGLALSCASTVVLLKALQDRRLVDTRRGQIAIGWLIVEDIMMVLALVLIPALSGLLGGTGEVLSTGEFLITLAITLGKVVAFVAVMLVFGKRAIPWILERVAATGSRELFGLSVLAIALGFALGSTYLFGVSFALGAFFAGMMLAESDLSHRAAEESLPLREVFSVLFFVSVGMLFDPSILLREPLMVVATVFIIVIGKSLVSMALVLAFRYPLSTALTISASLAQIGEFSFILATLGISLGILPPEGRDLILAGAIFSIILNPLVFFGVDYLKPWLDKREGYAKEPETENAAMCAQQQGHTILIGYGELGQLVGEELKAKHQPFIIVEDHPDIIHDTHLPDTPIVYGYASAPGVLDDAKIDSARCMVLTISDAIVAGQLITYARSLNPNITTIARASSDLEAEHLKEHGATHVIVSKREVAKNLAMLVG
ncbi:YbaL family putative K(+) efflux transporter [Solimicrobium silvestre]|uniref:2a37: transporter, monovalent cation:proton antiporter-2 (CPA2) family n=1 Tax=Solimicrobium silvestre TaxID=2099400 RepID=A0A2S9GZY5_9BURK|nr:YbaL family putative K(+) efflux transporter [Solimicrobium silvestre]PRC93258.1 2a37: transporter, monovalent cation:proton antiporter-2 (CPA2) family [Solimicrobium silvestre]